MQKVHSEIAAPRALAPTDEDWASDHEDYAVEEHNRPIDFIKEALREIASSPEIKANLMTLGVGFAAAYLSKLWFKRISGHMFKRTLTIAVLIGLTQVFKKGLAAILAEHNKD